MSATIPCGPPIVVDDTANEQTFVELARALNVTPVELVEGYLRRFARLLDLWRWDDKDAHESALCNEARVHVEAAARCLVRLHVRESGGSVEDAIEAKTTPSTPFPRGAVEGVRTESNAGSRGPTVASSVRHRGTGRQ